MKKIAIIDCGIGNLRSVQHAFQAIHCMPELVSDPTNLEKYDHIVLPGVGAFDPAIKNLKAKGFDIAIQHYVQENKGKLLGLCLGLQLLFEKSSEVRGTGDEGRREGIGLIKGEVRALKEICGELSIPHVGWNSVRPSTLVPRTSYLLQNIPQPADFYFTHSYYCKPEGDLITYTTPYGQDFISAFETGNIMACQFHPEKSHDAGLQVLKNFAEW